MNGTIAFRGVNGSMQAAAGPAVPAPQLLKHCQALPHLAAMILNPSTTKEALLPLEPVARAYLPFLFLLAAAQ